MIMTGICVKVRLWLVNISALFRALALATAQSVGMQCCAELNGGQFYIIRAYVIGKSIEAL